MSISRWDPFGEMMDLRRTLDRLFDEGVWRPFGPRAGDGDDTWTTDVYETEDGLVVKTAMPGVKPEDIRVNLIGNTLTIEGECRMDETPGEGSYHRREHRYGRFRRSFSLPVAVRADEADASFDHGMLT